MSLKINNDSVLIVGSDSRIGKELFRVLNDGSRVIFRTTRRKNYDSTCKNIFFLDLGEKTINLSKLPAAKIVYLIACVTSMVECSLSSEAYDVNVSRISEIGSFYLRQGGFVVFLSSNAVFDGDTLLPDEFSMPKPLNAYGDQKYQAEKNLLQSLAGINNAGLAIVRLTKVMSQDLPLLRSWSADIYDGKFIEAFSNLKISPISLQYAVTNLKIIGESGVSGTYHLSGLSDIAYSDIAEKILKICSGAASRVIHTEASRDAMRLPTYSALGMLATKNTFDIFPQNFESFCDDVLEKLKR